jgi:hypothetical protein
MVVVRFKRVVFSHRYGSCAPGELLRCDEAFARHVVHDLAAAEYVEAPRLVAPPVPPKRRRSAAN